MVDVYPCDEVDVSILRMLAADARASQRQVAAALGISAPTVSERMAKMERAGVIRNYSVQIDWAALGYSQIVFLTVSATGDYDIADVMKRLWELPEAEEVTLISGDVDLLVKLRVRDHYHLRELLMDHIWQITGLKGTATEISIAEMPTKNFAASLLHQLESKIVKAKATSGL
ncbi:Lrp/AsnC family transcriptional regulator [Pseudomonas asiatica]|uniref:Lrp/AsnC family transcriptional regulator n=1 Tax=Pseudomonas asiatica TaxID=2219225 RepID=UPI00209B3C0B|nr:Lrp/AsnC family transcriptional regulator [Pseudomonas asiatica]MCO7524849.1 Lrp/AsnC family transcriptional regulator [Pseudomonas asiatica]